MWTKREPCRRGLHPDDRKGNERPTRQRRSRTIPERDPALEVLTAEYRQATARSRALLAASRETIKALRLLFVDARQQLSASRKLVARAARSSAFRFHDTTPPTPEANGAAVDAQGTVQTFAAVTELIKQVECAATEEFGVSADLVEAIVIAIDGGMEPSVLIGILLEGMIQTVERLPAPERRDTAIALCGLLWGRFDDRQA
jgi:hypothetical protein